MPTVSFQAPNDYSVDQADIERRRQYALALQQQALQPSETKMVGGWAIPNSPLEGLSKVFQAYAAKRGLDKASEQQKALGRQYQEARAKALSDALRAGQGTPASSEQIVDETANGGEGAPATINAPAVPGSRQAMIAALANSPFPDFQQAALAQSLAIQKPTVVGAGATAIGPDGKPIYQAPFKPAQVTAAGANGMPETRFVNPDANAAPIPQPVQQSYVNTGSAQTPVSKYVNPAAPAAPLPISVSPNTQATINNAQVLHNTPSASALLAQQGADIELSPDAQAAAAARYNIDGTLPPMGFGQKGAMMRKQILDMAAAQKKAEGVSPAEQRVTQIGNLANKASLSKLQTQSNMVGAFERTFNKNADMALEYSDKVDRTGAPVVNSWINAGKRAIAGNPELSAFDTAVKATVNEYTKIISGSMGNTPMAEGEIKKVESLLSAAQTPAQVKEVIGFMRRETANRMKGFEEEKAQLRASMSPAAPGKTGTVIRFDAQGNMIQ